MTKTDYGKDVAEHCHLQLQIMHRIYRLYYSDTYSE